MESRGPSSVDEEVAALSRGADRDSLFMQASLILPGQSDPVVVRVRNLSAGGMLAEAKARIAQDATVEVELRNVGQVPGRVVWAGEGKFGIAFDRPVDPQAVRRQVVSESDLPPHLRRTGLERGPLYRRR
ncbi:PilZ domain-containing protein [Sphingopyxis sp.]|uniref:PilZ domain-containing protein n=1 Tax=Sphingopyxis sp. TaxID=1908224 RepID=UPI002ED8DEEE